MILIGMMIALPVIYLGLLQWQRPYFHEEENRTRQFLKSKKEWIVLIISEAAWIKIWCDHGNGTVSGFLLTLLYTVLAVMTALCMTDLWEKIVPNRILLMLLMIGTIEIGIWALCDVKSVLMALASMIIGFIFCVVSFGLSYIFSRGSLGSGDVKLAVLLGIFLTGEYVVGTIFYGCIVSALFSIVQLCRKKVTRKDAIPFVPFLYIGLIITYLVG